MVRGIPRRIRREVFVVRDPDALARGPHPLGGVGKRVERRRALGERRGDGRRDTPRAVRLVRLRGRASKVRARANAAHRRQRVRVAKSFAKRHKLERFGVRAVFVRPRDVRPDILRGVRAKAIGEIAQMRRERRLRATLRRG